jgi:hypothetical protein
MIITITMTLRMIDSQDVVDVRNAFETTKVYGKAGCQGKKRWRWKGERQEWRRSVFYFF